MTSEWALAVAAEIEQAPEPIEGLTAAQCKIVHILKAAKGRPIQRELLASAIARDPAEGRCATTADAQVCYIRKRRPDVGACIITARGLGYFWRDMTNSRAQGA